MDEQATTENINQRSLLCFVLQDGGLIKRWSNFQYKAFLSLRDYSNLTLEYCATPLKSSCGLKSAFSFVASFEQMIQTMTACACPHEKKKGECLR